MKRITVIIIAGIALLATAAVAHQNSKGTMHRNSVSAGNCPMNGNMAGMMNSNQTGTTLPGNGQQVMSNWKTDPSYQGQVNPADAAR